MNDSMDKEVIQLDDFMEKIEKSEISVPAVLDQRIQERIGTLKRKKYNGWKGIAVCAVLIFLFVCGVKWSPDFAAYAGSIPGLKAAVEWLQGDQGIQNAKSCGYPEITPVTVQEEGYTLTINHIFMDEDRAHLSAWVTGEAMSGIWEAQKADEGQPVEQGGSLRNVARGLELKINFTDFEEGCWITSDDTDLLACEVEQIFKGGEMETFLKNDPQVLHVDAQICQGEDVLHQFKDIEIPIDPVSFQRSRRYDQNQQVSFENGKISINQLTISPTRMRLDVAFDMNENYFFTGFENHYLKDDQGHIYRPEGLVSTHWSENGRSMYFVPSVYFDQLPRKLYFCFDGVRIGTEKGKQFTLSFEDRYPKEIEYMDETVTIQGMNYDDQGELNIEAAIPKDSKLEFQGLNIVGYDGPRGWSAGTIRRDSTFDIERRESYEVVFEYPGYLIPLETALVLELE